MKVEEITDIDKTAQKVIQLHEKAKKSIEMSTGLHLVFHNKPEVREAIQTAARRIKGTYNLLLDSHVKVREVMEECHWVFDLQRELGEKFSIRQSRKPIPHWIIVDGKHFRIGKPHPPTVALLGNAVIWDADRDVSVILQKRFYSMWEDSYLVTESLPPATLH